MNFDFGGAIRLRYQTMVYAGWIDLCSQTEVMGWTEAPSLDIVINGDVRGRGVPGEPRVDAIQAGYQNAKKFCFQLGCSLWLHDRILLRGPDGSEMHPSPPNSHLPRLYELIRHLDLTRPGLEFGPLDRPIVPKCHASVSYIDHLTVDGLHHKYSYLEPTIRDAFCDIDYVLTDTPLNVLLGGRRFAWVVASHVGEHIPDFVGWLKELAEVLEPGGRISLALPNAEKTWDSKRRQTDFADLIDANLNRFKRPSPRQILDQMIGIEVWRGEDLTATSGAEKLLEAHRTAEHSYLYGNYVDVHCSVFTPASFRTVFEMLGRCGQVDFDIISITEINAPEFFVALERRG